jgi:hypothetical protein
MRMAKAFIAAALIAVALVGAVVVPAVLTHGKFGFDNWPDSPAAQARTETVVVDEPLPVAGDQVVRSEAPAEARSERRADGAPAPDAAPALPDQLAQGPRPPAREVTPPASAPDLPAAPQTAPVETPQPDLPAAPEEPAETPAEAVPEAVARPVADIAEVVPPAWGIVPGPVAGLVPIQDWLPGRHRDDTK